MVSPDGLLLINGVGYGDLPPPEVSRKTSPYKGQNKKSGCQNFCSRGIETLLQPYEQRKLTSKIQRPPIRCARADLQPVDQFSIELPHLVRIEPAADTIYDFDCIEVVGVRITCCTHIEIRVIGRSG